MAGTVLTEIISCGQCCLNWMCSSHRIKTFCLSRGFVDFPPFVFFVCSNERTYGAASVTDWQTADESLVEFWEMTDNYTDFFVSLFLHVSFEETTDRILAKHAYQRLLVGSRGSPEWQVFVSFIMPRLLLHDFFSFAISPSHCLSLSLLCSLAVIDWCVRYDGASWR